MDVEGFAADVALVAENVRRVVRGKDAAVDLALICLFAGGHLLVEDRPGVGKTLLARSIAASLRADMKRIQFTPDLQPTDVTGMTVYDQSATAAADRFPFHKGPLFTNVVLADEINRASPRTQAALLEAMEERQVSFDGQTHPLPDEKRSGPFFVVATQNPLDAAGTYPLPDAQLDRFLMRLSMGYPAEADELRILRDDAAGAGPDDLSPVLDGPRVLEMIDWARAGVTASDLVYRRALEIVDKTRKLAEGTELPDGWRGERITASMPGPWLRCGASPRAAVALMRAARVAAACRVDEPPKAGTAPGPEPIVAPADVRRVVEPCDLTKVAVAVLAHRLQLAPVLLRSGVTSEDVVNDVLRSIPGARDQAPPPAAPPARDRGRSRGRSR
ncbi:AAA family ATPase [Frankia sp. CNm7]|uniref:AAA family ATPase n=1 Tax=Frankia nepalensis TaxID=1836974 RepID=A0A937RK50_9ACTN|nr:AAA family ATPase [Frankia nepalensis]MBL7500547.1 AAA family ATPase [Frankia nepalensis]MBL7509759.1 AAA family ATPase [Frankia nepalensis]MBL7523263.1 AAA family ATPase [Frankia nepalensis]MBL7627878.1 AAA family ATPase [Frankia nepalensis]